MCFSAYMEIIDAWPYARAATYFVEERTQPGRRLILALMPDHIAVLDAQSYNLSYAMQFSNLKIFGGNEGMMLPQCPQCLMVVSDEVTLVIANGSRRVTRVYRIISVSASLVVQLLRDDVLAGSS